MKIRGCAQNPYLPVNCFECILLWASLVLKFLIVAASIYFFVSKPLPIFYSPSSKQISFFFSYCWKLSCSLFLHSKAASIIVYIFLSKLSRFFSIFLPWWHTIWESSENKSLFYLNRCVEIICLISSSSSYMISYISSLLRTFLRFLEF